MKRQKKDLSLQVEVKKNEVVMSEENNTANMTRENIDTELNQEKLESEALELTLESVQREIDEARLELEKTKMEIEEKKQEAKSIVPRRDISEDEQKIIDKQINNINKKKNINDVIEKQKAYDNVMVTGRFMNRRAPGQQVKLTYNKYSNDPVKWYIFKDGGTYTIPRGFVDQINEYYHTPIFVQKEGPQSISEKFGENSAIAEVDKSNKKYAFVALGFAA